MPRFGDLGVLVGLVSLGLMGPYDSAAQYTKKIRLTFENGMDNPLFEETFGNAIGDLEDKLKVGENMAMIFNPAAGTLNRDEYKFVEGTISRTTVGALPDYVMEMIFDPCRGKGAGCCSQKFGAPEYIANINTPQQAVKLGDGSPMSPTLSRLATKEIVYDKSCLGVGSPIYITSSCVACSTGSTDQDTVYTALECELKFPDFFKTRCSGGSRDALPIDIHATKHRQSYRRSNPLDGGLFEEMYCHVYGGGVAACAGYISGRDDCVAARVRLTQPENRPDCWDYNATVKSGVPCRDRDGVVSNNCVSIAYAQNAYIVECNGPPDPHCGTYLEVHEPDTDLKGNAQDNTAVLTEARIPGGFVSGFETITLPTYFRDDMEETYKRILCEGDYELWWVQRTKSDFRVERKRKFRVVQPACDWDKWNKGYTRFHTLGRLDKHERYYCTNTIGKITRRMVSPELDEKINCQQFAEQIEKSKTV